MPIDLTPLPPTKGGRLALEDIDADVAEAVDSAYEFCKDNPGRLKAEFGTKEAAEEFLHAARSYAYHHDPRLMVSGNPTAKGEARFRVELYVAPAANVAA